MKVECLQKSPSSATVFNVTEVLVNSEIAIATPKEGRMIMKFFDVKRKEWAWVPMSRIREQFHV